MNNAQSRPQERSGQEAVVVPRLAYRWVILGICWAAYVVIFMQRLSIGPLAPFLKEDLNLTSTQVGFFISAIGIGFAAVALPSGWLVDRLGIRWILAIGEIIGGIFVACLFYMSSFMYGLVMMTLAGLGMGCILPATTKAILQWFPTKERATVMGFKQTGVNIGGIASAATLPALALAAGWRYGFLSTGLLAVVLAVASVILYRDPPPLIGASNAGATKSSASKVPLRDIFKNRDIWALMLAGMFLNGVEFAVTTYFVLYLQDTLLFSVVAAGFLLALLNSSGAFGKPLSGLASDFIFKGGRKKALIFMAAVMAISCVMLAFLRTGAQTWLIIIIAVVFGFTAIGWAGLELTLVAEFAGRERAGIVTGANAVFLMIASIVATPLFGYILDTTGSYFYPWLFLVVLSLLAGLLLLFVREERRRV